MQDFANPEVAPHIQKYPEDVDGGPISEIWQLKDGRWHDIPLDQLTPSILIGHKRYYVHEVAELSDGRWVIPALWITCRNKIYADCHLVERNVRVFPFYFTTSDGSCLAGLELGSPLSAARDCENLVGSIQA